MRDRMLAVQLRNGTRVILPLLEVRCYRPISALISTFGGCYGGLIADGR
ncbi:hypothetical protein [Chloroflexus sp.]|nr:hypothetical protein [uncultured Chloroflexus sp.]